MVSPRWSILVCINASILGQKLPIWTAHHAFLESRYSEITKNPYYVLPPEESHKKLSAHGLITDMTEHDIRRTTKKFFKINGVETEKMEFHCSKKMINKNNVDVQKKLVSDEFTFEKTKKQMQNISRDIKRDYKIIYVIK